MSSLTLSYIMFNFCIRNGFQGGGGGGRLRIFNVTLRNRIQCVLPENIHAWTVS